MAPDDPARETHHHHHHHHDGGRRRRWTRHRWEERLTEARQYWFLGWLLCAAGLTWLAVMLLDRIF